MSVVACSKKATDSTVKQQSNDVAPSEEQAKIEQQRLQKEKEAGKAMSTTPQLPGYTPTGNPDVDAVNYSKAKEDLYNNHPEQYQQWAESMQNAYNQQNPGAATPVATQPPASTPQIIEIPYEEYIQMPQEKRDHIDAHPELYKVVK
ncbi:hypothetical protein C7N43_22885 [Sphingobacteriales bacterium UPWRP_1]|nr:hypothetical protein B6N25_14940 [Sphingobacteriales bacterium TSM_CSS]PSJ74685.1 hypothetical protein C7N43_22885 [Sphingobacteriales bacterium UPWRP_1]